MFHIHTKQTEPTDVQFIVLALRLTDWGSNVENCLVCFIK